MPFDEITQEFIDKNGRCCSITTLTRVQAVYYLTILAVVILLLNYRWDITLCLVSFYFAFWYLFSAIFKTLALAAALLGRGIRKVSAAELALLDEESLPVFTILVPLYHEEAIADKIIRSVNSLDYPSEKLDVKLLLEEDDQATIKAVRSCSLPSYFDVIVVPDFMPKTKPRACNFGLRRAKGEFCVIYDAEDRPDLDQLKKVVATFRKLPENYACIQAKLNYYNSTQNLLTRWFTIEYSTTFDLILPGLETLNIPLPLGGTSNHFRTGILRELGGWDPFNVTEDCDLGVRIYTRGYRTCMIDSTTWEEANSQVWNWIRQRSRWVKGFFQTHLTHTRNPFRTLRELGLWGMLGFYLCVGGSSLMLVINIIYWALGSFYLALLLDGFAHGETLASMIIGPHIEGSYQGLQMLGLNFKAWPLLYIGSDQDVFWSTLSLVFFSMGTVLLLANFLFVLSHVIACLKRKAYALIPDALLTPLYWVLMSVGAWKGLIQLLTNPSYWEKTNHGLAHHVNHIVGTEKAPKTGE